jgi:hypothetical protein
MAFTPNVNLQQLLQDIVHQLGKEERIKFREFVRDLKAKRDLRVIPSLSEAILKGVEGVVGAEVLRRACEMQKSKSEWDLRNRETAAASARAESSTEALDGSALRALMDDPFRREVGEFVTAEVPKSSPRGDAKLRATQSPSLKPDVAASASPPPLLRSLPSPQDVVALSTATIETMIHEAQSGLLEPLRSELAELKAQVANLKRQRPDDDAAIDLTDEVDEEVEHCHKRSRLGEQHDAETMARLARVKQEKAEAVEEKKEALEDKEDAQETLGYQVRTTDALMTKIDELAALARASGADAAAVNAIRDRPN